jgi:hypothetical protein
VPASQRRLRQDKGAHKGAPLLTTSVVSLFSIIGSGRLAFLGLLFLPLTISLDIAVKQHPYGRCGTARSEANRITTRDSSNHSVSVRGMYIPRCYKYRSSLRCT